MILVTGVSGALGGLVLERLVEAGGAEVVGGTRVPAPGSRGARRVDFDEPGSLAEALAGVDVLVFVSAGYAEDDVVLARHGAVVDAAAAAGVRHAIYTSLAGSGEHLTIALAHRWTEARLAAAPFATTVLRNGLYAEVPAGLAAGGTDVAARTGVFGAPLGAGGISVVAREDLADVAARVALQADADLAAGRRGRHAGRVYELEGVEKVGGEDIAGVLAEELGRPVRYESTSPGATREALDASGLLPYQVGHTLSLFSNARAGLLAADRDRGDLQDLLTAPPRPVRRLIADAVRAEAARSAAESAAAAV
ncbi:NAD(P)H-binding protein [Streptomyces sp. NBC_01235]|uniref:NAD(P)H-binding protein n=1 Tax=Streptomyces sp. NBC_01235 TaxID=2903788 RepID=UPI002E13C4B7|nr:NAD(P)H-binding protein [Streptomyces sp. NBC_01235]